MVLLRGTSSSIHCHKSYISKENVYMCCLICTLGVQTDLQYPLWGYRLYKWSCGTGIVTTCVVDTFNNVDATTKIAVIT